MRTLLAVLLVLAIAAAADATVINRLTSADARIDAGNPDTNYGDEMGTCATGRDSSAVLWAWDLTDLAGETATSDGTFNLFVYWHQSTLGLALYELTGGAFDEMTVTYNNYVGAGTLDDIVGAPLATTYEDGGQWLALTVPQATLQGMIDGTIAGLATRNPPTEYWNHCQATREREFHEMPERRTPPYLVFEATPEPATLSLLALGGLAMLRRRK
jgi:PEP-CTERM motif-containing protein